VYILSVGLMPPGGEEEFYRATAGERALTPDNATEVKRRPQTWALGETTKVRLWGHFAPPSSMDG